MRGLEALPQLPQPAITRRAAEAHRGVAGIGVLRRASGIAAPEGREPVCPAENPRVEHDAFGAALRGGDDRGGGGPRVTDAGASAPSLALQYTGSAP